MQVLVTDTHLTSIANAIRAKNGTTTRYKPADMAAAILRITTSAPAGGGTSGGGATPTPTEPSAEKTKRGSFTITAKEDGVLAGYTAGKIMMALPNHQIVKFRAVIFCATGTELAAMAVSDFASGRAWKKTNAYCSAPTRTVVEGGTSYVMEWEELINVTQSEDYLYDDDRSNDKLTYYCCAESKVKTAAGSTTSPEGATLTVEAYA